MNTARLIRTFAPVAVVVALGATACTDADRRELGEEDVRDSLRAAAERVVDVEIAGDLNCTSTIAVDGAVTGSCTGTTDDGQAVEAVFAGTADVDRERCSADLTVSVAGEQQAHETATDCFDS
jgi:hypothetical protein